MRFASWLGALQVRTIFVLFGDAIYYLDICSTLKTSQIRGRRLATLTAPSMAHALDFNCSVGLSPSVTRHFPTNYRY